MAVTERWRTRYCIAVAVLAFACSEYHRIISACISAEGCKEGLANQALIEGIQQLVLWSFIVVIMGRAAQPLINRFAIFKLGGAKAAEEEKRSI